MSDNPRVEQLISDIELAFAGSPWYGHGVLEKLNALPEETVRLTLPASELSVSQIVAHMIAWRKYAIAKLQGDEAYKITLNSSVDWPPEAELPGWDAHRDALIATQTTLVQMVSDQSDAFLDEQVPGESFNYYFLLSGILQHDIYHLGQIGCVARMVSEKG